MGRMKKAGESGIAAQYLTRGQALRKLQVSLPDFRRLCILKGIYPRDPKKKANGRDKTYYHKKDILFLQHEPLLKKFRDMKVFLRHRQRLLARHEESRAAQLERNRPVMNLDHLIKERFPTFVDALRDVDDALTLVHLFARLPSRLTSFHSPNVSELCLDLCRQFQSYVAREHCLTKVFVSIKGVYFQAVINGETVTWIVPHKFAQQCPDDVDYKVMFTFLEFYMTLIRFVNFKLYHDVGLVYPPAINKESNEKGQLLSAVILNKVASSEADEIDPEFRVNEADAEPVSLPFRDTVVLLSREVPSDVLEFVLTAGGARVIHEEDYDASVDGDAVTHQIVDRPAIVGEPHPNRDYVQPQWVFDSFNIKTMLPVHPYAVGKPLPPHLSPFVDDDAEGYVPAQRRILDEWANKTGSAARVHDGEEGDESEDEDGADEAAQPAKTTAAEDDDKELAKIMMTKKNKRLYSRMQHGIAEKRKANEALEDKRRKARKTSKKSSPESN
ncbi:Pescadillo like protein [Plasmodiophora brassicae]|uniref:Pescadillo homolog n=1 Tax=Plasmodiophora brassicae TaxID=37360 RepID=A0A3P3YLK4_PLABS|nr:unnamed protein product [Plasmodiophora brassicae]